MDCSTPGLPIHHQLLELAQTHVHRCMASVMPSNHLILCHPLLLPSILPSIGVFSNGSALCIRWPSTGASASASVFSMNKYLGLISFKIDWFDLLAVQGTLKSPSNTTVQFFGTQPSLWSNSHICTWLWKNHSFAYTDFTSKVMSLIFNTLSRLVIAFLPRSKHLWISWLQSPSAVILEPKKIKSVTVSTFSLSMCYERHLKMVEKLLDFLLTTVFLFSLATSVFINSCH